MVNKVFILPVLIFVLFCFQCYTTLSRIFLQVTFCAFFPSTLISSLDPPIGFLISQPLYRLNKDGREYNIVYSLFRPGMLLWVLLLSALGLINLDTVQLQGDPKKTEPIQVLLNLININRIKKRDRLKLKIVTYSN